MKTKLQARPEIRESQLPLGRVAGRYTLLRELGTGGMAAVYLACEEVTGRRVALKRLRLGGDAHTRARHKALFEREYHTLVRLQHPRIIEVYDYGLTPTGPYYTMELLEGADLEQLAPLPYHKACEVLRDVASSLALLHAHRLVHRDLSPRNVRLGPGGRAKLIDFGALTAFGVPHDVIGTPGFMAPEVLACAPLDQRTDLFALGAIGYFMLCSRLAYPTERNGDLQQIWRHAPVPLVQLVPDIPAALDTLISSLLKPDPLARPISAADVIDRLTAIGELPPEEHEPTTRGYLLSSRMVGRDAERGWFAQHLERSLLAEGAVMTIEGAAGSGKTRLLHELTLEAQLRGMAALKADAQGSPEAYGVSAQLAKQLVRTSPELARDKAAPYAGLLGHLSSELRLALEIDELSPLSEPPNERHARLHDALHEWFLAVAREQRLMLAVDNAHVLDERSAGFLAGLAREGRAHGVLLLVTVRSDATATADEHGALQALRGLGDGRLLERLPAEACEDLVLSLFGDIANARRIARLFYQRSGGNPQHCMELAHYLVDKSIIKYTAGSWTLPLEVGHDELPKRSDEIEAVRLSGLTAPARTLADTLSIHSLPVPIERCRAHAAGFGEAELYAALAELVAHDVIIVEGSHYRFARSAIRLALLASLSPERRRTLHVQAGQWLLETNDSSIGSRVEAGWHLLHGGLEAFGADILVRAGRDFVRSEFAREDTQQVVEALEAAYEVYVRQGRSDLELAAVLLSLVPLSYPLDRRLPLALGEQALRLGLRITGLQLAHELRPKLGRRLSLGIGLAYASAAFARARRLRLGYDLPAAVGACYAVFAATLGVHGLCFEPLAVERIVALAEPLRLFGDAHLGTLIHDASRAYVHIHQGREHEGRVLQERLEERFRDPKLRRTLGEQHWKFLDGALLSTIGTLSAHEFSSRALQIAVQMERLGFRSWKMAAIQLRMLHHALRGESEYVRRYRERAELFAVQGNPTWQSDMVVTPTLLEPEFQARNAIAVRSLWEQLARRAESLPTARPYADAAQAAYLTLRGELEPALALYDRALQRIACRKAIGWCAVRGWYAAALNGAHQHERARQVALDVLRAQPSQALQVRLDVVSVRCQLALAELGLGHIAEAGLLLDQWLAEYGQHDQPLYVGLLHKVRALAALAAGDSATFKTHLAETERRFRSTRNPALIAQWEQVAEQGVRQGLCEPVSGAHAPDGVGHSTRTWQSELEEIGEASNPWERALQVLVHQMDARHGYLYRFEAERIRLLAATSRAGPPADCERQLERLAAAVARARQQGSDDEPAVDPSHRAARLREVETMPFTHSVPDDLPAQYRIVLLSSGRPGDPSIAGGVIFEHASTADLRPDIALMSAIGRRLADRAQPPSSC